ncbi:MAG TPA: nuclear transport factor 2 family protein [Caulobacteraceae bacterium]|nr:nuclear transport factor 2 family protein [Caulobacteraceae bacterium]
MRKIVCVVASAAAAASIGVASAAASPASDEARLRALEADYVKAFSAEDLAGLTAVYAPDVFVFDAVPPRQYVGWEAYKKDWAELFALFPGGAPTTMSDLSLTVAGSVAYGHNIQSTDFVTKDGQHRHLVVRVSDVFRKADGQWRIVQEHVSFPVDLSTDKPDLLSTP